MADPQTPLDDKTIDQPEVQTNRALEQGLGVGARELEAIGESGEKGTLEQGLDENGEPIDADLELSEGRSASVLDRDKLEDEQLSKSSDA